MKFKSFLILASSLFFMSCSNDDEVTQTPSTVGNDIPTVYHPIKIANYWNYETENIAVLPIPEDAVIANDKLIVDGDVVLNTFTYKKMKTEVTPTGFYGSMLNNNNLRIDGSSLKVSGTITTNLDPSLPPLEFNVNDFVIFKENGIANEVLTQTSPVSFLNTTLLPTYPLTFTYSVKSICLGDVGSMSVKGIQYNNVKKTRIEIELKIITFVNGVEGVILQPQKVIISDQYYAKNIGVIRANTVVEYNLAFAVSPDVPQHGKQVINDYITSYLIN